MNVKKNIGAVLHVQSIHTDHIYLYFFCLEFCTVIVQPFIFLLVWKIPLLKSSL